MGLGKKEVLRRFAPLDDGQVRFGWKDWKARRSGSPKSPTLPEAGRMGHPYRQG
jgi:hypothetical protein